MNVLNDFIHCIYKKTPSQRGFCITFVDDLPLEVLDLEACLVALVEQQHLTLEYYHFFQNSTLVAQRLEPIDDFPNPSNDLANLDPMGHYSIGCFPTTIQVVDCQQTTGFQVRLLVASNHH